VGRLEDIATGIKHEIRFAMFCARRRWASLTQTSKGLVLELEARKHADVATKIAKSRNSSTPSIGQRMVRLGHRDPCHSQQESRIDTVLARGNAGAA
jgi:hypothetical protein